MASDQDPSLGRRYIDEEGRDGRGSIRLPPAIDRGAVRRHEKVIFVLW